MSRSLTESLAKTAELMAKSGKKMLPKDFTDTAAVEEYHEFARALSNYGIPVRGDVHMGFWLRAEHFGLLTLWYTMHGEPPFGAYVVGPEFERYALIQSAAPLNADRTPMTFAQYVDQFMLQKEGADKE